MQQRRLFSFALGTMLAVSSARAGEIGYVEDFVLSKDRAEALQQLIPGTEEYYYYHALHLQHLEQFDKVDALLERWIKQHNYTDRVRQIQHRQMLLTYDKNPTRTLTYLTEQLGLRFDHQQQSPENQPTLPTELDPAIISRQTLTQDAFNRYQNLQGFNDSALDWLVASDLNAQQRRHLLARLQRPDYPNLVKLIIDDLNTRDSRGFGSFPIHHQLLLEQLDACLKAEPTLKNEEQFVRIYLSKLQPSADDDWRNDPQRMQAHFERLWKFVSDLSPTHNSLKANVLYHWLAIDRSLGKYPKDRFMAYLQLPRPVPYAPRPFLDQPENRKYPVDLNYNSSDVTQFGPIGNDEPLVRDYLMYFFADETTFRPYEAYVDTTYLRELFAETKLLLGQGDAEQWYAMLPPARLQQIKDRIDLDFVPTNPQWFASDDDVVLELDVKNVPNLLVKVFEINALNYFRTQNSDVNTNINLDGLVANNEQTYKYDDAPLRRVRRRFEFPAMKKPGIYVVDFIGNGKNSRVVVRKGRLDYVERLGTAGHVFTVIDDHNRIVPDATLWMKGRAYTADKDGSILVPYSTQLSTESIVIAKGDWASLHLFAHQTESYVLSAAMDVDRESLLTHNSAQVIVRPHLMVNGIPVSVADLEEVTLHIRSTDVDGIESETHVRDFKLFDDRESIHKFHVPSRLTQLQLQLTAKIKVLSTNQKVDLATERTIAINGIDRTDKLAACHLLRDANGYTIEYLGKSGEPRPRIVAQIVLHHRDFEQPVTTVLQTDKAGRIALGPLVGIHHVSVNIADVQQAWSLFHDRASYQSTLHIAEGETLDIPFVDGDKPTRERVSLLELRGETFSTDRFEAIQSIPGMLRLKGLAAGDYDLWLKTSNQRIRVRVGKGTREQGYVLGPYRKLEESVTAPLQVSSTKVENDQLLLSVANADDATRVHIIGTRYVPSASPFDRYTVPFPGPSAMLTPRAMSFYQAGRDIGDEYRYIIDRRFAPRLPGNMLDRPSLLLNPWSLRDTQTTRQDAAAGNDFAPDAAAPAPASEAMDQAVAAPVGPTGDFGNLDFLPAGSVVLANLRVAADGTVRVPLADFKTHPLIHIVVIDPSSTLYRMVLREAEPVTPADLRLAKSLDTSKHFAQQKQISAIGKDEAITIADTSSSRMEVYDSLRRVYSLYRVLGSDARLAEFEFVLDWPKLTSEEKTAKYSEYACHELNFFLYHKDRTFFQETIRPYLANKADKTFLDLWLLEADLSNFLLPWQYNRLNVVEQALLAQRMSEQNASIAKDIHDRWELQPPNYDRWNVVFETALKGSALVATVSGARGFALGLEPMAEGRVLADGNFAGGFGGAAANAPMEVEQLARGAEADKLSADDAVSLGDEAKEQVDEKLGKSAARRFSGRPSDRARYKKVEGLFQQLDKTKEWAENNYYKLPIEQQLAALVGVNTFWNDYVHRDPNMPFRSIRFADATSNLTEMLFALAVLDLPFESPEHKYDYDGAKLTLTAKEPMLVFHEQILDATARQGEATVLVSQNFFRADDRFEMIQGERHDKFVAGEMLAHVVYGCQLVVTNPSSSQQKVDVLVQIPAGSIPVNGGKYTRGMMLDLPPYHTQTVEYYFYFPRPGEFSHFPVHISKAGATIANVEPVTLTVVPRPTTVDESSWEYVSQMAPLEKLVNYLKTRNLHKVELGRIAFRLQDQAAFDQIIDVLQGRRVYDQTLWSYGIKHNRPQAIRSFLAHADGLIQQTGSYLDSPLLAIDPVDRHIYQELDYRPLVNARAHSLGRRRQIVNDRFFQQYHALLGVLSLRPSLNDDDKMSVTAYLLLQDRVAEALQIFQTVNADRLATRLQYDYFTAYFDCFNDRPDNAIAIAGRYAKYPVDRWRQSFEAIQNLARELDGSAVAVANEQDVTQRQTELANAQPSIELTVANDEVQIAHRNVETLQVNFYQMDLELLFSRQPFVQQSSDHFSFIRPNATETITVPRVDGASKIAIPEKLRRSNLLVEVVSEGQRRVQTHYANQLQVQMMENYGQLRVTQSDSAKPLPRVYVKVYAQMQNGQVQFYKDGYTDIRGRFDYTSLSTNDLDGVAKFALLLVSDDHGATVRDALPPKR